MSIVSTTVRVSDFEEVEGPWEEVLPRCFTDTVFVTPWWQKTWWRHFGRDAELRLLALHDDSTFLGIAPLMLRNGTVRFLGDTDVSDYGDFIVSRGNEALFYETLMDYLPTMDWDGADFLSLPQDSPALTYIPQLAERKGLSVNVSEEDKTPLVCLPATWEEFLAGLTKKDRHELRRKLRRLEGSGSFTQYVVKSRETMPAEMEKFFRLHRASRVDKAEYMTPQRESFFTDIAVELASRDQMRLAFLELDGVTVASCITFDYRDSYLLYNSGYDLSFSNLSVGLLNKALEIREAIGSGKRVFDFLRGDERYKYNLGAHDRSVFRLTLRR